MRVLILSVGTRCKLVEYFKNKSSGFDKVIVTDCNKYAPAIYKADQFYIVSKMTNPKYLNEIMEICINEKVDIILPLQEDELLLMAKNKSFFEKKGILMAISDYESILLCKDKYRLFEVLSENGIATVKTVLAENVSETDLGTNKMFIKPRYGAGSVGTMKASSKELIDALINESSEQLVVQPYVQGKEYGVDVYIDYFSGKIVAMFCKEKIRMRAGETEKSVSVKNKQIEKLVGDAVLLLKLKGAVDVDILEKDGEYYILEINPRFGGGYPHAYECGIDFTKMMSINASGRENHINCYEYQEGILALKYSEVEII